MELLDQYLRYMPSSSSFTSQSGHLMTLPCSMERRQVVQKMWPHMSTRAGLQSTSSSGNSHKDR